MIERILSNRYVLNEVVGMGGMAVVYRAWDRVQLREVAVKVLRSEYNEDDEFVRRFNHEAHAAAKMSHPNIVNMYDVGQDGDMRYIVMEYVRGRTLKDVIRQAGRIKPRRAVQMTLRILAAVDHAHRSHIVHRDIKPQNILVDAEGNVKVADFGIARVTNANTQTMGDGDSVLGSVHYFSPEQASGELADEKSDLYSVGVVLYEMLTGRVPFDGETAVAVALKHVQEPPKSARVYVPEISKGLDEVLMKSLEKDADRRYQTAADFANDLKRALSTPRGGFVGLLSQTEKLLLKQERRGRRKIMFLRIRNYALFAVVVAMIILGLIYGRDAYRQVFARIQCPDVVLLNIEDADADLKDLGLIYKIESQPSDENKGTVLRQSPEPGARMWPGERVLLWVSSGKEKLMMPKLTDLSRSEAVNLIVQNDLVLNEADVTLVIADAEYGKVVNQEPRANEWVKPGDSVKLWISGEPDYVPSVLGLPVEEGKEQLESIGFNVTIIEKLSPEEEGTIIEQSVKAGTLEVLNATIQLTVSQAMPLTYRAQETFTILIPEGGADVRGAVVEGGEEFDQYTHHYDDSGNQYPTLDMEAQTPGEHTVRIYVNGELTIEKTVEFE